MGSFTELTLSFYLRENTPPEVLAAFAALEKPGQPFPNTEPAPALPAPVVDPDPYWSPDWRDSGAQDEYEATPWVHDWASWLEAAMDVHTIPTAALVWQPIVKRWHLSCRASYKADPDSVHQFLEWLGPFVHPGYFPDRPLLIGQLRDEGSPRPYLLWADNGRLTIEDLNPPDAYY